MEIEAILNRVKTKYRTEEINLINETKRILHNDLFSGNKILNHLDKYKDLLYVLDESDLDYKNIYLFSEIKRVALNHRLLFSELTFYKQELPNEALIKVEELNGIQNKDLKYLYVLSTPESFNNTIKNEPAGLFAKTNNNNYYLVHTWGNPLPTSRKLKYWALISFEKMAITVFISALIIALLIPSELIIRDQAAPYLNGYRLAMIFHLLILFSSGVVFYMFSFNINFTNKIWNRYKI